MREEALEGFVQVTVGSLDTPEKVQLDDHVWTQEQLPWFKVVDELPRFSHSSSAVPSKAQDDE